jgi:hypothetical protein
MVRLTLISSLPVFLESIMKRFVGCLCLFVAACSSNDYGEQQPYPTTGQLLINGKPEKDVLVVFHLDGYQNTGDPKIRTIVPQGWTDAEGKFVLSTFGNADGAPAGDYHVTVRWPVTRKGFGMGPDALGEKFSDPKTSTLTAHLDKKKNEVPPFQITANLEELKPKTRVIEKGANKQTVPVP